MSYWEMRFERLKRQQMGKAEAVMTDMRQEYIKALTALRKEVLDWYYRYAAENGMSLADARRELNARELKAFRLTLKGYIELAKKKNLPPEYIKMLDKASIRARLDRSQELYIKTAWYVEELAKLQNLNIRNLLSNVYEDSVYKTAYETQKLRGEYSTFREVAKRDIETAISKPWATDGKDFSTRIWENKAQLINTLQTEMTRSFMIGEGAAPLINRIQKRFNVSFSNARRLVETETAYVQEKGMLDTYEALDVEQYQILAVLDMKTSDICRHLDKKVFDKKDAKPGITAPPFHCYCRSTTTPYIDGITDGTGDTRAARDPVTGKTVFVESDLSYEEWYNKYVVKGENKQTKSLENDKIKEKKEESVQYKEGDKNIELNDIINEEVLINKRLKINGVEFIPNNTIVIPKKVIAGLGSDKVLKVAKTYAEKYGVSESGWSKVVGTVESKKYIFDVHWYHHKDVGNIRFKIKSKKEGNM